MNEEGIFEIYADNALNTPYGNTGNTHFFIRVLHHTAGFIHQTAYAVRQNEIYERGLLNGKWDNWKRLATATPPQEYDLALGEHVVILTGYPSKYWKNPFGEVGVLICLAIPENVSLQGAERIAMLPEGFHPQERVIISAGFISKGVRQGGASIDISQDGSIYYFGPELTFGDTVWGTTTFVAQGS